MISLVSIASSESNNLFIHLSVNLMLKWENRAFGVGWLVELHCRPLFSYWSYILQTGIKRYEMILYPIWRWSYGILVFVYMFKILILDMHENAGLCCRGSYQVMGWFNWHQHTPCSFPNTYKETGVIVRHPLSEQF